MTVIFLSLWVTLLFTVCVTTTNENTLKLLHVIFRHGQRTPDYESMYPNDPNIKDTWYPIGYGQLTNVGKRMEFNIGKELRARYGTFLGSIYTPDHLQAISTNVDRTKMSLELVLAGLFPPDLSQTWNQNLPWQPIPYTSVDATKNPELAMSLVTCPSYAALYKAIEGTGHFAQFLKDNANLINYINKHSGLNITDIFDLTNLYSCLFTELTTGRKVPLWTSRVYPEFLTEATILFYELLLFNSDMVKLSSGGHFLKQVLHHAELKVSNTLQPESRKLFLYSAHDYNVAYILGALNVFKPEIPTYACYVVIELHNINDTYGFKILYQNYSHEEPQYLRIPGCTTFCPLNKVVSLLQTNIPSDHDKCS